MTSASEDTESSKILEDVLKSESSLLLEIYSNSLNPTGKRQTLFIYKGLLL